MTDEQFWYIVSKQKEWSKIYLAQRKINRLEKSREEKKRFKQRNNITIIHNESLDCTR